MCLLALLTLSLTACSSDTTTTANNGVDSGWEEDALTPSADGTIGDEPQNPDATSAPSDAVIPAPNDDAEVLIPDEVPWDDDPVWQCENGLPISAIINVVLPANSAGCPWSEGNNLSPAQSAFSAHQTTTVAAELPGPAAAICAVNLQSAAFDPDYEQPFTYDDHFILAFNDVVLLSSYGDLVDSLPPDRNLFLFDWSSVAGTAMNFNNNSAYCLGYGGDDPVGCSIPSPESNGPVAYSVGGGLGAALSSRAVQEQRVEFMLVTFGDNDPDSDCRNSELTMQVVVDYVIAP